MHDVVLLETLPLPCVVADGVFDAYGWCASHVLEWRRLPSLDAEARVEATNPPGLVFVLRDAAQHDFLPRELARLHAFGYGLADEEALAPWAIDDALEEALGRTIAQFHAVAPLRPQGGGVGALGYTIASNAKLLRGTSNFKGVPSTR